MPSLLPSSGNTPPTAPDWLRELGWADVYEVRRLIGRGGMGRVYEAWHRRLHIPVALKIIDPSLVGDAHIRARFEKEALTLARLQQPVAHPNIVRILDFKMLEDVGCIVMTYVEGTDIKSWCNDAAAKPVTCAALIAKAARGAGYIHSCDIVHRDLKPANILVREEDGEPVIVDFGIVRGREDVTLTRTQQALGTAAYMAPEQLRARGCTEPGPRADVYALGVILYELLTGSLPHGATLSEVLPRHQQELPPRPLTGTIQRLPRDLEKICLKAISTRPEERYNTGADMAADLERYLAGEPVLARPVSRARHTARQLRRRPALAAAVAACICIGGWAWYKTHGHAQQMELARMREVITGHLAPPTSSTASLQQTDEKIRTLAQHDPEQAAHFRQNLVQTASSEVTAILKQARLSESALADAQRTIDWMRPHDAGLAARLELLLEKRQQRWEVKTSLKPPFTNAAELLNEDSYRLTDDAVVFTGHKRVECLLKTSFTPPFELAAEFTPPADGPFEVMTFKALLFDQWYSFQLYRQIPRSVGIYLAQLPQKNAAAPAGVLVISTPAHVLAALPLTTLPLDGHPIGLRLRVDGAHLSLQLADGPQLDHWLLYKPSRPVTLYLIGVPALNLRQLTLAAPASQPKTSSLEKGDHYAGSGNWEAAERYFLTLAGDLDYGAEALFKAGDCQSKQGRQSDAQHTWEHVTDGEPSIWRTRARLQIWLLHTQNGELARARPYLDALPPIASLPPDYFDILYPHRIILADRYRAEARGLRLLRPSPEVEEAIRVHRLLRFPDLDIAARFTLARHFNGQDEAARDILRIALKPQSVASLSDEAVRTLNTCLELRSLSSGAVNDPEIIESLDKWHDINPPDHSIASTIKAEAARRIARGGSDLKSAAIAREVMAAPNATPMAHSGAALLLSVVAPEADQAYARAALKRLADGERQLNELVLTQRIFLHSLVEDWTPQLSAEILGNYLTLGYSGEAREIQRSLLSRHLLTDHAMVQSLNQLLGAQSGQALLEAHAKRTQLFRETTRQLIYSILRRQIIFAAFGNSSTPQEQLSAAAAAQAWLKAYEQNQITEADFLLLLQSWNSSKASPALTEAMPRWPAPLKNAVQQVFLSRTAGL